MTEHKGEEVSAFTPNHDIPCIVCGQKPTVDSVNLDGSIDHTELCGPCCFGEADCIDPENW